MRLFAICVFLFLILVEVQSLHADFCRASTVKCLGLTAKGLGK